MAEVTYPAQVSESIDKKRRSGTIMVASMDYKKQEIDAANFMVGEDITSFVVDFYEYLGYSGYLAVPGKDGGTERLINQAQLWFRSMVVDNRYFPTRLPISFVLRNYVKAMNNGDVERPYANLVSQAQVLRNWLLANKDTLMDRAYRQGVIERPKALQAENPISKEERKQRRENGIKFLKEKYGEEYKETKIYKALMKGEE